MEFIVVTVLLFFQKAFIHDKHKYLIPHLDVHLDIHQDVSFITAIVLGVPPEKRTNQPNSLLSPSFFTLDAANNNKATTRIAIVPTPYRTQNPATPESAFRSPKNVILVTPKTGAQKLIQWSKNTREVHFKGPQTALSDHLLEEEELGP